MSEDDDFIERILNKQASRSSIGNVVARGKSTEKIMSYNPKDTVRGQPVLTQEQSDAITEWKNIQKMQAEFKKKHGMQGYAWNEIKLANEGKSLTVDMDKVKERKTHEQQLVKKMVEQDAKSSQGIKHYPNGKTVTLKEPEEDGN